MRPIGRERGLGVKESTDLPYARGASGRRSGSLGVFCAGSAATSGAGGGAGLGSEGFGLRFARARL